MPRHRDSLGLKAVARIRRHGRGWVFTSSDFADLAKGNAVKLMLFRLAQDGTIRQLARGLYEYPRQHTTLGILAPTIDAIAQALANRLVTQLQPSGAYAANLLGLTEQVPLRAIYLTDGPSRSVKIGSQEIVLKKTTPKNMATAGRISGLVIQALRYLGQDGVDNQTVALLRQKLTDEDKKQLIKDVVYAPAWIAKIMREVAA